MIFTASQLAAMDRDCVQMKLAGLPLSQELQRLETLATSGSAGIQSDARDVDSLSISGGHFRLDTDTAPGTSLTFAWLASYFFNAGTLVVISAGSLMLSPSSTNYIQVDGTGTVSANTSGFTTGANAQCPLMTVAAGVSSWTPSLVIIKKPIVSLVLPNSITGLLLSQAQRTLPEHMYTGGISGTQSWPIIAPAFAGSLASIDFVNGTAVTPNDTNYWSWSLTNLGAAGAGSTQMLDTGASNTTKATGGSALAVNTRRGLTLNGTPANLNFNARDTLQLTLTATGSPTALTASSVRVDFAITG